MPRKQKQPLSAAQSLERFGALGPRPSQHAIVTDIQTDKDPTPDLYMEQAPPFLRQLATRGAYVELEEVEARASKLRTFLGLSPYGAIGSMVKDALAGPVRFVGDPIPGRLMPATLAGAGLETASGGADFVGDGGLMPDERRYRVEAVDKDGKEAGALRLHEADRRYPGKRPDKPAQKPQERRKLPTPPTLRKRKPMSVAARARIAAGAKKAWAVRKAAEKRAEKQKQAAIGDRTARMVKRQRARRAAYQEPKASVLDQVIDQLG